MNRISKSIIFLLLNLPALVFGQEDREKPRANWQNLDFQTDGLFGISTERSYQLLKNKKSMPVIVAVIDGGVDINHEDLKDVIWVNKKEVPGNKVDEDKNGYKDDVHGWDFLGSDKGSYRYDNLEVTRLIRKYQPKYASVISSTPLSGKEKKEYELYKTLMEDYANNYQDAQRGLQIYSGIKKYSEQIITKIGKQNPSLSDFESYKTDDETENHTLKVIKKALKKDGNFMEFFDEVKEGVEHFEAQVNYNYNLDFDPRDTVGDNYADTQERFYGNNDVKGPDAEHGTHVAGIIGANRGNTIGVKGVADNVRIMGIRTVPNGDERDKDVANAIRYAVDNGAKVINMSFGKAYSPNKSAVDSAVRYAMTKDVLLVHAAGNESKNTDKEPNFPNRNYTDSTGLNTGVAAAWIEVGASGWKADETLAASFSNYGKKAVDVFAPGVQINSTMPESKYKDNDGTSMAAPVVSGLAALIRSYYPKFSALEVKNIILESVTKVDRKVKVKDGSDTKRLDFEEICATGGIVNAYQAIQLAEKKYRK